MHIFHRLVTFLFCKPNVYNQSIMSQGDIEYELKMKLFQRHSLPNIQINN